MRSLWSSCIAMVSLVSACGNATNSEDDPFGVHSLAMVGDASEDSEALADSPRALAEDDSKEHVVPAPDTAIRTATLSDDEKIVEYSRKLSVLESYRQLDGWKNVSVNDKKLLNEEIHIYQKLAVSYITRYEYSKSLRALKIFTHFDEWNTMEKKEKHLLEITIEMYGRLLDYSNELIVLLEEAIRTKPIVQKNENRITHLWLSMTKFAPEEWNMTVGASGNALQLRIDAITERYVAGRKRALEPARSAPDSGANQ